MKKPWLDDFRLYLITDRKLFSAACSLYFALEDALSAGVKAIQLREKDLSIRELLDVAHWMRDLTNEYGAKLVINDRVDIALAAGADGVHLGQQSMPPDAVRKIAGNKLIIGVSAHGLDEAVAAEKSGADFITIGPVYKTPSKLKYGNPINIETIKEVKSRISIPVLAIGGIKKARVHEVREAGADGIAMISAILTAEDIQKTTEEFLRLLQ
jgi:thiamine-phosphate pyrophosphorylase